MEFFTIHSIQQPVTSFGRFILNGLILSFIGILSCSAGLEPEGDFYDRRGNKIGTDGKKDGKKYIVTKGAEARTIRKITKMGGTTSEREIPSSVVLPSNAAIKESLDLLRRTEENGGLKEQSSIVMKDESVIRGAVGERARIINNYTQIAECILPSLPEGKTRDDVETTIHPHPTAAHFELNNLYLHSATIPSRVDRGTFAYYTTNIIVGPLEAISSTGMNRLYGTPGVPERRVGIAVYYYNGAKPSVIITKKAAERILKN
jgi:hypothetical protein